MKVQVNNKVRRNYSLLGIHVEVWEEEAYGVESITMEVMKDKEAFVYLSIIVNILMH